MTNKEIDFSFAYEQKARFRVNAYHEQGNLAAALRLILMKIPRIDTLNLPEICHTFTKLHQGFILVTGPTGHGKSTTLAAVVEEINQTRAVHIVTVEDLQLIERVDEKAVTIDPCIAQEEVKEKVSDLTVMIDNFGPDSITQSLMWSYDSTRYSIKPAELALAIGPEEKSEYTFKLAIHNGSDVFPIPQFVLNYPFDHMKSCTLRNYLPVKRLKSVKHRKTSPVIDGRLGEQIWKTTERCLISSLLSGKLA